MPDWLTPDWTTAIASLVAGFAAAYGIVLGIYTYRESVRARQLTALVELETSFERTLPFFAKLEDDQTYESAIRPMIRLSLDEKDDRSLDPAQVLDQADLERALRFFYTFWIRIGVLKEKADLLTFYSYYLAQLANRDEVRRYAEHYYPDLLKNLMAAQARRTRNHPRDSADT